MIEAENDRHQETFNTTLNAQEIYAELKKKYEGRYTFPTNEWLYFFTNEANLEEEVRIIPTKFLKGGNTYLLPLVRHNK